MKAEVKGATLPAVDPNFDTGTKLPGMGQMDNEMSLAELSTGPVDADEGMSTSTIVAVAAATVAILSIIIAVVIRRNKALAALGVKRAHPQMPASVNVGSPYQNNVSIAMAENHGTPGMNQSVESVEPIPQSVRRVNFEASGTPAAASTPTAGASTLMGPADVVTPAPPQSAARTSFWSRKKTPAAKGIHPTDMVPPQTQPRRGTASRLISLYERLPSLGMSSKKSQPEEEDHEVWNVDVSPTQETRAFETPYQRGPVQYDLGVDDTPCAPGPTEGINANESINQDEQESSDI